MIQHLGRYQIISELGRGGMGVVYKALDPNLERHVAIKCLSEELSQNEIFVARFLREARNVAALNHPNCVRLYVADEHEGQPFFVMEFVDGDSLADHLAENGRCAPNMAKRIVMECAEALAAADEKNIVHRDVKPGNVMLDRNGRALLTDFGIACVQYGAATASSEVVGTPGYMAPELIEHGRSDRRSDIFALGAVWYEMLLGRKLIPNADLFASMEQFKADGFPDLNEIEEQFGTETAGTLAQMLARNPEDRFVSYNELLKALRQNTVAQTIRQQKAPAAGVISASSNAGAAQIATAAADDGQTTAVGARRGHASGETRGVPVAGARRYRGIAIAGGVIGGIAALSLAIAALNSGDLPDTSEPYGQTDEPSDPVASQDAALPNSKQISDPGIDDRRDDWRSGQRATRVESTEEAAPHFATRQENRTAPPEQPDLGHAVAIARPAPNRTIAEPDPVTPTSNSQQTPPPAAPAPRRVTVLGVGDPTITDPMRNEIEAHLRQRGQNVADPGFIRGLSQYVLNDGLDLAGLADAAGDAGIRYAVMVRARPLGTRELKFYGRYATSYSVQVDAVTYDLVAGSQVGSSNVEQIEYTSLNATQKARDLVRPWLAPIGNQFRR